MKLTLELLGMLDACEQGIDFAKRNNIIGRDIKEFSYLFKVKDKDGVVRTILIDRGE